MPAATDTRADRDPLAGLDALIQQHESTTRPRLAALWEYYRNPATHSTALAPTGVRRRRLAQERALPERLTGPRLTTSDDRAPAREIVIENDIAWRIHTMVDFMFGRPIVIASTARDPSLRRLIDRILDAVFETSGGAALLSDIGLLGHIYGHIDLLVRTDLAPLEHPPRDDDERVSIARSIRVEPIEPTRGVPMLDHDDYRRITAFAIRGRRTAEPHALDAPGRQPIGLSRWLAPWRVSRAGASDGPVVTEVFTAVARRIYLQEKPDHPARLVLDAPALVAPPSPDDDSPGLPIVHIQNISQPFRYEGLSEVEPLIPLQDELNTRLSDRASRVTMQSFKMYLARGLEGIDRLAVGPGQVWSTDNPDASIESFGGDGASPSEDAHIQEIREALDKASGVPPLASGVVRAKIGNLTSENALRVTLMGLLSKTARKRVTYGRGLAEVCRLILLALERAGVLATDAGDRDVRIEWPDPLPRDERDTLDAALKKLEIGVPRERVLSELGYSPTDPGIV